MTTAPQWTEAMRLDHPSMDTMNQQLMDLLARAHAADDAQLPQAWADLVAHTALHFGQEDRWMRETAHGHSDTHVMAHRVVLNLLREGLMQARAGDLAPVRRMARELGAWFARHTQSCDAPLALHLRSHAIH